MKGLPYSGKTEWATKWVSQKSNRIRLSWSEGMRMMTTRKQRELRVVAFDGMLRMMKTAFELGYDVVIDECNLNGFEWGIIITRAQNCHAKVEWHTMTTPLEECKRRAKAAGANISDIEFDNLARRWEVWLKQKG